MRALLFTVMVLILVSAPSFAQAQKRHAELDKFETTGGKVEFLGNAYGLDGWLLTDEEGPPRAVYTTPQGGLVLGMMVGPNGENQTQIQIEAYKARATGTQAALPGAEKTEMSKTEQLYALVEKAAWVSMGDEKAPYIYMFANVNCDHCQKFFGDLQGALKSGQVQLRIVPFGAVAANREGGAALLSSDNPLGAWADYAAGNKESLGKDKIKPGTLEKVDANSAIFKEWKMQGPPFTIYRKPATGVVTAIVGRPENTLLVLADMVSK